MDIEDTSDNEIDAEEELESMPLFLLLHCVSEKNAPTLKRYSSNKL